MMWPMRTLAPALAALAGCGAVAIDVVAPATIADGGAMAPGFTLKSQLGEVSLAGGSAVMLVFYRGHW